MVRLSSVTDCLVICFFQCFGYHRDLHSFPTRRSSDLRMIAEKQRTANWGDGVVRQLASDLRKEFPGVIGFSAQNLWYMRQRSEEHTSELQSLRHLVCRLLLEKKKKESSMTTSQTDID